MLTTQIRASVQGVMASTSAIGLQQWVSETQDEQDASGKIDAFFERATSTTSVDQSQSAYLDSPSSSESEMASAYDAVFEKRLKDCNAFLDHSQQAEEPAKDPKGIDVAEDLLVDEFGNSKTLCGTSV